MVCVVKHEKDPKIYFDNMSKPKDLTEEEANLSMNKMIQDQKVKQYVYKKQALKNNKSKKMAILLGQCTSGVQSVFKEEANFEQEE